MNPQSTYVDPLLTDILVGYKNAELIADILFPKVMVNKESGIYFKNDKSNLVAPSSTKRGLNAAANRVTGALTEGTYQLQEHSLEEWIDDRILDTYDAPFEPRRNATNRLSGKLLIEKENELISLLANSGATALDAAGSWATAGTDIRDQMNTGKDTVHKATGVRPNTLVFDRISWAGLLKNTDIKGSIAYTSDRTEAKIRSLLAAYFDVDRVLVAGGISQSADSGGTGSFLWSTKGKAILAYVNDTPAIEETSAGYQFVMEGSAKVDVRREEGAKSDVVRASDTYELNLVDTGCLYLINDTMQT